MPVDPNPGSGVQPVSLPFRVQWADDSGPSSGCS